MEEGCRRREAHISASWASRARGATDARAAATGCSSWRRRCWGGRGGPRGRSRRREKGRGSGLSPLCRWSCGRPSSSARGTPRRPGCSTPCCRGFARWRRGRGPGPGPGRACLGALFWGMFGGGGAVCAVLVVNRSVDDFEERGKGPRLSDQLPTIDVGPHDIDTARHATTGWRPACSCGRRRSSGARGWTWPASRRWRGGGSPLPPPPRRAGRRGQKEEAKSRRAR